MVSERQKVILQAIIQEFMKQADAVGSMNIVARHHIGASPATVRNEMVVLANKGFLTKEHSSSGRIPTDMGLRFFVKEMMQEEPLPNTASVKVRIRVFRNRFEEEQLMSQVMSFLTDTTGYAAVSMVDKTIRFRGISQLLDFDELKDVSVIEVLLRVLENSSMLNRIFCRRVAGTDGEDKVCVVIGEESEIEGLQECALVFTSFDYFGGRQGYIGIIGPRRMRYSKVIPAVKAVGQMVETAIKGW
jgi:heat-inducible transcriptional repressor